MHHPVHPHSQDPGRDSDREGGQHTAGDASGAGAAERGGDPVPPTTGPFSGSAENGYRPAARVSVPNPYTTRRVNVDDVDTGATPVGQWRGVGLDEPEPRPSHLPATTDAMTETPSPSERAERPESPAAHPRPFTAASDPETPRPRAQGSAQRQPEQQPQPQPPQAQHSQEAQARPEPPQAQYPQEPEAPAASRQAGAQQAPGGAPQGGEAYQQPPQAAAWGGHEPAPRPYQAPGQPPAAPAQGQPGQPVQGQYGYGPHPGHGQPGHDPYAAGPYQQAPGAQPYGAPHDPRWQDQYHPHQAPPPHPQAPRPEGYAPAPPQQYGGYAPYPQGQPAPYPQQHAHYPAPYPPQPLVAYQNAYPAPFQPPGYVLQGQPVFYPGQYNPYGQPVQHVIVLTAGQQPKVISADAASTLFAEQTESNGPAEAEDVREDRALAPAQPEEAGSDGEREAGRAAEPRTGPEEEPAAPEPAAEPAAGAAPADAAPLQTDREQPSAPQEGRSTLLNEALAGLAMRDLSLVDALLEMVEELETDAQDPDLLEKLFQIDNFATRMRRNGENFLVLTGHDGGESDAHDEIVPLLDVARAATSEIKDYPRVRMGKIPQTSITGMAADDISHLLAELLDNATANSPEHSQVVVSAQVLDDGRLMLVVEDEGVGVPENQLAELNERLNGDPVLDDDVPRHMGLYVASRIARKHGLETRLESRSFRGVSAYTIIPKELLRVATPRTPGKARTSTVPTSAPVVQAPPAPTPPRSAPRGNGSAKPPADGSAVTSAGLPRRSATPHGSPLRMMPRPGQTPNEPPKARKDTPPRLSGEARAEQIRDELGDFFDGEREAREGADGSEGGEK